MVVHTYASNAYAFMDTCLFCTSIYCRPSVRIYLYGEVLFGELSLEKKCRTFGVLSFISLLF